MVAHSLKRARLYSFVVHGGYALMILLMITTNNWMIAFVGLLVALFGFAAVAGAARCPKCSTSLLQGGRGIDGALNLLRLSAGAAIPCADCKHTIESADYR